MTIARRHVCLATPEESKARGSGGRHGTCYMTVEAFAGKYGDPHEIDNDGSDTPVASWFFQTPRGIAAVHTYWWNGAGILSIGDRSHFPPKPRHKGPSAARWLIRYLNESGARATGKSPHRNSREIPA